MRLIDADALMEAIRTDVMGGLNYESFIKEAPTIDAAPHWILCEERLPEVGEEVLCQCRANIIEVLCLEENGFWENPSALRSYLKSFVVAWMPLPEPYEEEERKNDNC